MQILRLNKAGDPLAWITPIEAVVLYSKNQVLWEMGSAALSLRGGINKVGIQSSLDLAPVIACEGRVVHNRVARSLTNYALFKRDDHMCLYCGETFPAQLLTRDHIHPSARGGGDAWQNVVAACKPCNNRKGCRTPEEAGMELLALPFIPNNFEYMYLAGRKVLFDQMEYLKTSFHNNRAWAA